MFRLKLKEKILERDKYTCVRCGRRADAVHHILPKEYFNEQKNDVTNLVSVCNICHRFIHNQYGEPIEPNIAWYMQRYYYALRVPLLKKSVT